MQGIETNLPIKQMGQQPVSVPFGQANASNLFRTGNVSPIPAGGSFSIPFIK